MLHLHICREWGSSERNTSVGCMDRVALETSLAYSSLNNVVPARRDITIARPPHDLIFQFFVSECRTDDAAAPERLSYGFVKRATMFHCVTAEYRHCTVNSSKSRAFSDMTG